MGRIRQSIRGRIRGADARVGLGVPSNVRRTVWLVIRCAAPLVVLLLGLLRSWRTTASFSAPPAGHSVRSVVLRSDLRVRHMLTENRRRLEHAPEEMEVEAINTSPSTTANARHHEGMRNAETKARSLRGVPDDDTENARFLVFKEGQRGQGLGNIMKGLLMAIDLGHEFDRIVCIEWRAFHVAFDPPHQALCRNLQWPRTNVDWWDFGKSMALEQMRNLVASNATIVEFTGNSGNGAQFYKPEIYKEYFVPTRALEETIPWSAPPECVVQLRIGDSKFDVRKGLDEKTLQAMEQRLDRDCYLVTNHYEWYARFEKVGWGHPPWGAVQRHQLASSSQLELWSDWYTVMRAKRVYHTPSGFSESAAQAGGCISRKITGSGFGMLAMEHDGLLRMEYEKSVGLA